MLRPGLWQAERPARPARMRPSSAGYGNDWRSCGYWYEWYRKAYPPNPYGHDRLRGGCDGLGRCCLIGPALFWVMLGGSWPNRLGRRGGAGQPLLVAPGPAVGRAVAQLQNPAPWAALWHPRRFRPSEGRPTWRSLLLPPPCLCSDSEPSNRNLQVQSVLALWACVLALQIANSYVRLNRAGGR